MKIYLKIIQFTFLRFLTYPLEIGAVAIRRLLEIALLLIFWWAIARTAHSNLNFSTLIAYFLVSSAISDWIMGDKLQFAQFIQRVNRRGEMNAYLMRPLSIVPYLYATNAGEWGLTLLSALGLLVLGLVLSPPLSWQVLLLFPFFFIAAFFISFAVNLLIGMLAFKVTEAQKIRVTSSHVIRILAGTWIPLSLFPAQFAHSVYYLPFASMVFIPTWALRQPAVTAQVWSSLGIAIAWAVLMMGLALRMWKKVMQSYEGVGI